MAVTQFELAVEHANAASFRRSVDPTATRRMKQIMARKGWRDVTLTTVDYCRFEAGVDKTVSVYHYEIRT